MKKKIIYTNEDIKIGRRVRDFLPSPEEIAKAGEVEKITILLSEKSLQFFRNQAKQHDTSYQRMIRVVLDSYAEQYLKTT